MSAAKRMLTLCDDLARHSHALADVCYDADALSLDDLMLTIDRHYAEIAITRNDIRQAFEQIQRIDKLLRNG